MRHFVWRKLSFLILALLGSVAPMDAQQSVPLLTLHLRIPRGEVYPISNITEQFDFDPSGMAIAAAGEHNTLRVWDTIGGKERLTIERQSSGQQVRVLSVDWSPDGRFLASGAFDDSFEVWDAFTGELQYYMPARYGNSVAWSSDGRNVAYTSEGEVHVIDFSRDDLREEVLLLRHPGIIYQIAWSSDNHYLAAAGGWSNDYLSIWDMTGKMVDLYKAQSSVAWSPVSRDEFATAGQIRTLQTGLPVQIIRDMQGKSAWYPSGRWIGAISYTPGETDSSRLVVYDVATGEAAVSADLPGCGGSSLVWSSDGRLLATNCSVLEPEYTNDLLIWRFEA